MDFLKSLLDSDNRKHQNRGGFMQNEDHHDDDHDHEDDHHHRQQYPNSAYPQVPTNPAAFLPGVVCRNCSTQTVQGANFCHGCGAAIEMILNCASCGSKLPASALFCPQCGYKSG
jgi:ribosomal protein L40E